MVNNLERALLLSSVQFRSLIAKGLREAGNPRGVGLFISVCKSSWGLGECVPFEHIFPPWKMAFPAVESSWNMSNQERNRGGPKYGNTLDTKFIPVSFLMEVFLTVSSSTPRAEA